MISVKTIVFPSDLTPASEKVAAYVKYMADRLQAEVVVIHVARGLDDFGFLGLDVDDYSELLSSYQKELEERLSSELEGFVSRNFGELKQISYVLANGDPADEIVAEAERREGSLIVMGTHGRKGLNKVMFGSVAAEVVARASCPVMTVNPHRVLA